MLSAARASRARAAFTLAELLVGMTVTGLVLALLTAVSVREQRVFADAADEGVVATQLGDAAAILPIDLRALAPALGDVRDARDTAIEVRATIASSVVCDTAAGRLVLAPAQPGVATYSSTLAPVGVGDTAWILEPADTAELWRPFAIGAVASARPGPCSARGPRLTPAGERLARLELLLVPTPPADLAGSPLRVTRPIRYTLYRASDGAWYLGAREWNSGALRFDVVQPVAGPLRSASLGGLVFTYLDSSGAPLRPPPADPGAIRVLDIALRGATRHVTRALGAAPGTGPHLDSARVVVSIRNR